MKWLVETTGCLLDYLYLKENYEMFAIAQGKQQELHAADPNVVQQISFIGNLEHAGNTTMFFVIVEFKEIILNFWQRTTKVL